MSTIGILARRSVVTAVACALSVWGLQAVGPAGPAVAAGGGADPVLTAVGDVTSCDGTQDDATAGLAGAVPGPIALLGDLVEGKRLGEFTDCFAASGWGALEDRARPVPGDNGEYGRGGRPNNKGKSNPSFAGAVDCDEQRPCHLDEYHDYFGPAAGKKGAAWYSYDVGTWHVIAIDGNCADDDGGCADDGALEQWLEADLAAANARCTVVTMHHNFVDRPGSGTAKAMEPLLDAMYDADVDVVLSGHRHTYRRYAPVDREGREDRANGIRQFIVGTGGHARNDGNRTGEDPEFYSGNGTLEVSNGDSWGVLRLTLHPGSYSWEFVPVEGVEKSTPFTDAGTDACVGSGRDMNGPGGSAPPPPPPPPPPSGGPAPAARSGYWMVGGGGVVYPFGDARHHGDAHMRPGVVAVDVEPTPSGNGYWLVDEAGGVHGQGDAAVHGGLDRPGALAPGERVTSLSATPSGGGYWLFTTLGRAVAFGDAVHRGDMSGVALNAPVLDSVPTPTGRGYYMVAGDGGIFTFGDARFAGSMGGIPLNAPVQSLVPDGDGAGYWLVASDGGVFAFDAAFRGSMGAVALNKPVTGMVRFGNGYLMVAADGGIFNFSDRAFHGSLGADPPAVPIVAVAALD